MPLYEYYCADCDTKFEALRPMSKADDFILCKNCESMNTSRAISLFAAFSKGEGGISQAVAGAGGGCSTCAGGTCSTCGFH
jgi:putative FmdB family regulatory protein